MSKKDGTHFLDEEGREIMDPTPIAPPVGYKRQPSMVEIVRDMIKSERLRLEAEHAGMESFEEADDFEVDDYDPSSPYEEHFEPTPLPELRKKVAAAKSKAAAQKANPPPPRTPPAPSPEPAVE